LHDFGIGDGNQLTQQGGAAGTARFAHDEIEELVELEDAPGVAVQVERTGDGRRSDLGVGV